MIHCSHVGNILFVGLIIRHIIYSIIDGDISGLFKLFRDGQREGERGQES